eukprot:GEMP01011084.1.p1 GENE.GEMP01011084.1~~GEMP01011084.1.p1  ORF type:complete len:749 (+),score=157.67 GEMP01011084.1:89-2335(+)
MAIDFDPPEYCPPYREKCRCERLSIETREKVERASRALYLTSKQEEARIGGLLNDEWFRSRIKAATGPIMTLHEHYAGMGGRSTMGQGVGGFALGAACPSGGLCTVTAVSYDLPWFAKLLNHYLMTILSNHTEQDCMTYNSKLPSTFCCWQLNFGKNDSDKLSETCFYNPHVDKNNAKVSSIGTSFGDYEGGGVWVANPKGTTMVKFENDVEGIHRGLVPGQIASQKTRWVTFWAATNVHAIPPFRKNRVGVVAFSAQTALRATPEERKMLLSLGFPLPDDGDVRFLPKIPRLLALKGDDLAKLSLEELDERKQQTIEYNRMMASHQRNCDKMSIALARETEKLNLCRIEGETTQLVDGTSRVVVQRKVDSVDIENKRNKGFERNMAAIEAEVAQLTQILESLDRRIRGKRQSTHPDAPAQVREMEQIFLRVHAEFRAALIEEHIAPESDNDMLDDDGGTVTGVNNAVVAKSYAEISKAAMPSPIQIRDSLPLLPFKKRLPMSRSDRKKLERGRWKHKLKYGSLDTWKCPVTSSASSTAATSTASRGTSTSTTEPKGTADAAATSQTRKISALAAKDTNHVKPGPAPGKHTNHAKAGRPPAKHTHQQQQSKTLSAAADIWPPRPRPSSDTASVTRGALLCAADAHRNAHVVLRKFASVRHMAERPSESATVRPEELTSLAERVQRNVTQMNETSRKRLHGAVGNVNGGNQMWQPPIKQVRTMAGNMIRQPFLPGEVVLLEPETIAVED